MTSKVHLACDGRGRPLAMLLTSGNTDDTQLLAPLLAQIRVPRQGPGRPRTRPTRLLADKGYSSKANRRMLSGRGIAVTIPEREDQKHHRTARGSAGGRPYGFDKSAYRDRNVVERCFAQLKQWRGIASRFDKLATNYLGGVVLGAIALWLRT